MHVRPASLADAEGACEVLRRSILECCREDHFGEPTNIEPWLRNKTPEDVKRLIAAEENFSVVAEEEGHVLGFALLCPSGEIPLCYLVPEGRYRGIGKAMLHALEAEARRRGLTELNLESTRTGRSFYLRNGFAITGAGDEKYGSKGLLMWKQL